MDTNTLQTPIDALHFAIDFTQMDLEHAKPRELSALEKRIDAFLNPDRPSSWAQVPVLDRETLGSLQKETIAFFSEIVEGGHDQVDLALTFWAVRGLRPDMPPDSRANRFTKAYNDKVSVLVYGPPRDWFLYRIIRLLEAVGAEKLLVCPAPECERFFLKVTRKEFCSTRCQSRVYMRGYRTPAASQRKKEQHGKTTRTRRR